MCSFGDYITLLTYIHLVDNYYFNIFLQYCSISSHKSSILDLCILLILHLFFVFVFNSNLLFLIKLFNLSDHFDFYFSLLLY